MTGGRVEVFSVEAPPAAVVLHIRAMRAALAGVSRWLFDLGPLIGSMTPEATPKARTLLPPEERKAIRRKTMLKVRARMTTKRHPFRHMAEQAFEENVAKKARRIGGSKPNV